MGKTLISNHRTFDTEQDMIEGCSRNDRRAQHELYNRYCNAMYSIAFRILNDEETAHDALQEAFLKVFRNIKQFRGESSVGAWIKSIVVNCSLRLLKKSSVIEFTDGGEPEEIMAVEVPDTIDGEVLEKVILSLPVGFRTVFLLIEVEGYSHSETADLLGITIGTSKSQLSRAKKHLQEKLLPFID